MGVLNATEVYTVTVDQGSGLTPQNVTFDNAGPADADIVISVLENQTIDEVGADIVEKFNAVVGRQYTASFDTISNLLTLTAIAPGVRTDVLAVDTANVLAEPGVISQGADGTQEQQTFTVDSGATVDGYIFVGGVKIAVTAGMSAEEVGGAIANAEAAINLANPNILSVDYNTVGSVVTIVYGAAAGNAALISVVDSDNNEDAISFDFTDTNGAAGGVINLLYTAPGGTLVLDGANLGTTNVVIDGVAGTDDEFNVVLGTSVDHNGVVNIAGIEVLNVMTEANGTQGVFGVNAPSVETINVTGTSGVNFFGSPAMTKLETVNAADLDISTTEAGVWIETSNNGGTTFIGSNGRDFFDGGAGDDVMNGGAGNDTLNGGAGNDIIDGGAGNDIITGGLGADILTGGEGEDRFIYNSVQESQGVNTDTITDFTSGVDKIDVKAIIAAAVQDFFDNGPASVYAGALLAGQYMGEVANLGQVLTTLNGSADGTTRAVLDTSTSTLYFDVGGDGLLNDLDMSIQLTGVTALDGSDFTFV